jgi:hypothetical protein
MGFSTKLDHLVELGFVAPLPQMNHLPTEREGSHGGNKGARRENHHIAGLLARSHPRIRRLIDAPMAEPDERRP